MDKNNDKGNIVNNNHMENCNVFMGNIYGAIIPLPGLASHGQQLSRQAAATAT